MFYVPLYVEMLRSRPWLVFWTAALAQAAVWIAVPALFYSAPPSALAQLLAIGHEFRFDAGVGPPLAYWLAEIAFRTAGIVGVYILAQVCVVTTYWCVYALGRAIVGPSHAAIAALLMVGISLLTVPSPDFGPPILAMALWSMVLLHYWRAMKGERRAWYWAGIAAALLLCTSDAALLLLGALIVFTAVTVRGRAALNTVEPWIAALGLVAFLFLHLVWLGGRGEALAAAFERLRYSDIAGANAALWLRLLAALI
ncbi:MAG: glycosyltransferase family 39 protein, partial [Xanthobacteraceae bacterium]